MWVMRFGAFRVNLNRSGTASAHPSMILAVGVR